MLVTEASNHSNKHPEGSAKTLNRYTRTHITCISASRLLTGHQEPFLLYGGIRLAGSRGGCSSTHSHRDGMEKKEVDLSIAQLHEPNAIRDETRQNLQGVSRGASGELLLREKFVSDDGTATSALDEAISTVGQFVRVFGTKPGNAAKASHDAQTRTIASRGKRKLKDLLDQVSHFVTTAPLEGRHLTFVSHAGEDKPFARGLVDAIHEANGAAFFDDHMTMGTPAGEEMTTQAAEAEHAVLLLSRPFLTKKWPMKELHIFLKNRPRVKIHPLFHGVTPDELGSIIGEYDDLQRKAGGDRKAFSLKMAGDSKAWEDLMKHFANGTRMSESPSLPDPRFWRDDLDNLGLTGLRRLDVGDDNEYLKVIVRSVSLPRLPTDVRPLPEHFVKVPFVDEVMTKLVGTSDTPKRLVLTGMGGAGKTFIASAVARDRGLRRHFSDGVLWLNDIYGDFSKQELLRQLTALAEQFQEVVLTRRFRQGRPHRPQYDSVKFNDLTEALEFFSMWKKTYGLDHCLLVVDNVWSKDVLEAADMVGFHVLATTRKEDVVPAGEKWRSLDVPRVNEQSSVLFLQKYSGAPTSLPREPVLQVARDCAYLPLALALVGSSLRPMASTLSSDIPWRDLHKRLRNDQGDERLSINEVFAFSFNELGPKQQGRFLALAVLPDGIPAPEEMICVLWEELDCKDARVFAMNLVARSLVQRVGDTYLVHDLLLDFAKEKIKDMSVTKAVVTIRQGTYLGDLNVLRSYAALGEVSEGLYAIIAFWRSLEQLSDNEVSALKQYKASLDELEKCETTSVETADKYEDVARLLKLQNNFREAKVLYEQVLEINKELHGSDHPDVATAINNLAGVLETEGFIDEAAELYKNAIDLSKGALGLAHPEYYAMLNNYAGILDIQDEVDEAKHLYRDALSIGEKSMGLNHPEVAVTLNNLAVLLTTQGEYDEAKELLERAFATRKEILGDDHPEVAQSLNNIAEVHREKGAYDEAEPLYEQSLSVYERSVGLVQPSVAAVYSNWAKLHEAKGEYDKAGLKFKEALEIDTKVFGEWHREVMIDLQQLAGFLAKQGASQEAEKYFRKAIKIGENLSSPDKTVFVALMSGLADLLVEQDEVDEAGRLYTRATDICEGASGLEHQLANTLNSRALLAERQSDYHEARELYDRAIRIADDVEAASEDRTVYLTNLADMLKCQGNFQGADTLYKRALTIEEDEHGYWSTDVADILDKRGLLLMASGNHMQAEQMFARAVTIGEKIEPAYSDLARYFIHSGDLHKERGRFDKADSFYGRALKIDEEKYGQRHLEVATDLEKRGRLMIVWGKHSEAVQLLQRALGIRKAELGDQHEATATLKHLLDNDCHSGSGKDEAALSVV